MTTAVSGEAAFSDISIDNTGNGYTLTASAGGLTGATSVSFNIIVPDLQQVHYRWRNEGGDAWFDPNWQYRKKITIDNTKVSGGADHTNFPVLINSTDVDLKDTANGGKVGKANGGDIVFTASNQTSQLNHEIEKYDPTTGELIAWVQIPTLSVSADTDIYIYYGYAGASDQWSLSGTWETAYKGVWHLHDDLLDSTQYNNTGTNNGSTDSTGKIGDGQNFAGSQWVQAAHSASLDITGTQLTVSAWVKPSQSQVSDAGIVLKSTNAYQIHLGVQSSDKANARIDTATASYCAVNSTTTISAGTWYYISNTYDGSTTRVFVNGVEEGTCTTQTGNINATTEPVVIGRRAIGDLRWYLGDIDEPRMIEATRSADWLLTEYNNQDSPSTFHSVKCEENASNPNWCSGWAFRKKITIDNTKVDANLTDFPVYVDLAGLGTDFHTNVSDANGGDIRVTQSDGVTELPRQVVTINTGAETGELYFKADSLSNTQDTDFYVYYGNAGASEPASNAEFGSENVWSNGYVGVWHLDESPANGVAGHNDSTGNPNVGTPQGFNGTGGSTTNATGKIGGGNEFDGTDDYVDLGGDSSLKPTSAFSVSAWYSGLATNARAVVFSNGYSNSGNIGIRLSGYHDPTNKAARLGVGNGTTETTTVSDAVIPESPAWTHVVGTFDGATVRLYINGAKQVDQDANTVAYNANNGAIGANLDSPTQDFDGLIDEVRLSNVTRSDQWNSTEYNNQNNPALFYNVDSQEGTAVWAAAEDTVLTGLVKITPKRLRFEFSNEGTQASGAITYLLEVSGPNPSSCSAGAFSAVPTVATGHWQIVDSAGTIDGAATTNIAGGLTDENTTFEAGEFKDTGNQTAAIILSTTEFTEI